MLGELRNLWLVRSIWTSAKRTQIVIAERGERPTNLWLCLRWASRDELHLQPTLRRPWPNFREPWNMDCCPQCLVILHFFKKLRSINWPIYFLFLFLYSYFFTSSLLRRKTCCFVRQEASEGTTMRWHWSKAQRHPRSPTKAVQGCCQACQVRVTHVRWFPLSCGSQSQNRSRIFDRGAEDCEKSFAGEEQRQKEEEEEIKEVNNI